MQKMIRVGNNKLGFSPARKVKVGTKVALSQAREGVPRIGAFSSSVFWMLNI